MRKTHLLVALFMGLGLLANAQKDNKTKFLEAENFFLNNDFEKAIPLYTSVYNSDTTNYNAAYRLGMCYLADPFKRTQAIKFLQSASRNTTSKYKEGSYKETKAHPNALFYLGMANQLTLNLDAAIDAYSDYSNALPVENIYEFDKTEQKIQACHRAIELLKKPRNVSIKNVGEMVNSGFAEINPCLTADGNMMIYTRVMFRNEKAPDGKTGFVSKNNYRIMQSFNDGKKWSIATDITDILGARGEYRTLSVSAQGDFLLLYKDDEGVAGGVSESGSIYMTSFNDTVWSPIKRLPAPVNTEARETHASISSSGSMLYFTSDRKGTLGGIDIWGCARYEDGTFGEPFNLGDVVNTQFDEETPFLINDSLLFFSSKGHDNMGEFDIFFSKLNNQKEWSTPVNMAPPVNLTGDDMFFVPVKDGREGYYSVERHEGYKGFGRQDIFNIKLDVKEKVDSIRIAGSFAMDDNNELIPHVYITLVNPKTGERIRTVEPNYKTGEFSLNAPSGDYTISITADNYDDLDKTIYIPRGHNIEVKAEFKLKPKSVTSGEFFTVKAVFFDYSKYTLNRTSQQEIERLYQLMDKNPSLYIEVVGYTDSRGSASFNKQLSMKRSKAVIDYLVRKGIEESRFVSNGKGAQDFVAVNVNPDGTDNPEGRKLNRRVEMKIIKSDNKNIIVENVSVPDDLAFKDFMKYSIQIAKTKTKLPATAFNKYTAVGLPEYQVIESENGFIYYTGDFSSKAAALELLNEISEAGFDDATLTDYFALNKEQKLKVTKTNKEVVEIFTIQLRASRVPLNIPEAFPGINNVRQYLGEDDYYRYSSGDYATEADAKKSTDVLIQNGYLDAIVVNTSSYNKMQEIVGGQTKAPKVESKVAKTQSQPTISTKQYTVQLIAMKKKVPDSYFAGITGVKEHLGQDGFYRYYVGTYNSWTDAEAAQKNIESKGLKGSFVVNLNRFK